MSAVMKPESRDLARILVIDDQLPDDFYVNPIYEKRLDGAIEATNDLVYPLDETGEKAAKADATAINKFATLFDKFIAATFKKQTESVAFWRDSRKAKTKLLLENRQRLIDQFAERRQAKLDNIRVMLTDLLTSSRSEIGVKQSYYGNPDLTPMVKLTGAMTDGGKLTKTAVEFIKGIVNGELQEQTRIESRHLILENRCLKEGINPPLTQIHFGTVFYADDDLFSEKLEQLIKAEIDRKAEMEARIRKQQEEENERKIQAALRAQQEEANRIARAEAEAERKRQEEEFRAKAKSAAQEKTDSVHAEAQREEFTHVKATTHQQVDDALAQKRQAEHDQKYPPVNSDKRSVLVTVTFRFDGIRETVSNAAVTNHCVGLLPEKLRDIVKHTDSRNV